MDLSRWGRGLPQGQLSPQSRKREGAGTSAPGGPSAQIVSPSALIITGPWLLKVTSLRTTSLTTIKDQASASKAAEDLQTQL